MYFKDRVEAGRQLALRLDAYKSKDCVVLALNETSILVAAQVAMALHANLLLYLVRDIALPGEHEPVAAVSSTGIFRYNDLLSTGEIEEIAGEFRGFLEQERFQKNHELNVLMGRDGEIDKSMLRHRNVIVVADALGSGMSMTMAGEFLKTVAVNRIIAAVPVVSVAAVDRMHIMADELHVLGVADNFISTDHYFEESRIIEMEDVFKIMRHISLSWSQAEGHNPAHHHHEKQKPTQVLKRIK